MDILAVISGAGSAAWTLVFFVLSLAIIVAVHEYGHYIVGRWSGIHAEVFSLGFGPVIYARVESAAPAGKSRRSHWAAMSSF